jgi:hypothetical protein
MQNVEDILNCCIDAWNLILLVWHWSLFNYTLYIFPRPLSGVLRASAHSLRSSCILLSKGQCVLQFLGFPHIGDKSKRRTSRRVPCSYMSFVRSFIRNFVPFLPKNSKAFSKQRPWGGGVVEKFFSLLMYRKLYSAALCHRCVLTFRGIQKSVLLSSLK